MIYGEGDILDRLLIKECIKEGAVRSTAKIQIVQHSAAVSSLVLGRFITIHQYMYICTYSITSLYTVRHKKLHHFVFAITLSYLSLFEYLLVHIYRDKFGTN